MVVGEIRQNFGATKLMVVVVVAATVVVVMMEEEECLKRLKRHELIEEERKKLLIVEIKSLSGYLIITKPLPHGTWYLDLLLILILLIPASQSSTLQILELVSFGCPSGLSTMAHGLPSNDVLFASLFNAVKQLQADPLAITKDMLAHPKANMFLDRHIKFDPTGISVWSFYNLHAHFTFVGLRDAVVKYNDFIRVEGCLMNSNSQLEKLAFILQ
ncbi:hypothetical protein HYC85_005958 [Camellia sinensis]|uniref:Uncharacterized protein n=1 Tax=Camellia sinensis TaxID=4442 RepID=A0A7J7I0Z0_CAMSI|nr:hypothetical protein HYC85_005958 [Camellia sinensis]